MLQAKHMHQCFTLTKYFKHLVKVLKMLLSTSTQVLDPCLYSSLYVGIRGIFQDGGQFGNFQTFLSLLFNFLWPYNWLS